MENPNSDKAVAAEPQLTKEQFEQMMRQAEAQQAAQFRAARADRLLMMASMVAAGCVKDSDDRLRNSGEVALKAVDVALEIVKRIEALP